MEHDKINWQVELLVESHGWMPVSPLFPTRAQADAELIDYAEVTDHVFDLRVTRR